MNHTRHAAGHAVVEVALLSPWIFFLFIGILDFGFYAYTAIATANAARVAAMYTSSRPAASADAAGACHLAVEELRTMPNVGPAVTVPCPSCSGNTCSSGPVSVQVTTNTGANCPDLAGDCTTVAVSYTGPQMIPIPGLTGRLNLTRVVTARVVPE